MTTSGPTDLTPKELHDALVRRVNRAMTAVAPEDLTTEELQVIVGILEAAVDREPVDVVGNLVRLTGRRRAYPAPRTT
jgi:hypothetical protein